MPETFFADRKRIEACAWFVGERLDVRAVERGDVLALAPLTVRAGAQGLAVLFRYGSVVLFGMDPVEQAAFLDALAPLVQGRFDEPETESAEIAIDASRDERVDAAGTLYLQEASLERVQVVAEILAKSAVLAHYEGRVAEVFDRLEPLAERLERGGRGEIGSSRGLLRQVGDVLLAQTRTVGRVEITEKPEITWDRPDLDRLYERLLGEYELHERDVALSRKLELISRTVDTFLTLIHNRRSLRVEWYIVLLILIEVVLLLYDMLG